jgi:hypothetical protein
VPGRKPAERAAANGKTSEPALPWACPMSMVRSNLTASAWAS